MRVRVLPWAPFKSLRSSVERVADYESAGRRCESCRRHHFNAPVAQCIEHRASNAEVVGESPSGDAASSRNVNADQRAGICCLQDRAALVRHEEHVLGVPPLSMTLSSNWPRHPTFYRVIAGSNPARVANLNSETNMNREFKYHRDKKLLAIHRERRALWKRRWQTSKIDPPIPRGWIRHWRLTAKARNRHDAPVLKVILNEIDNPRFHWRKSFVSGKRRLRKMVENTQALCCLRERRWKRLDWPEDWKKYFRQIVVNPGRPDQTFAYKILREDLFELFIERNFVWEVRPMDAGRFAGLADLAIASINFSTAAIALALTYDRPS